MGDLYNVLRIVRVTQEEEVRVPSDSFVGMSSSLFFWVILEIYIALLFYLGMGKLYFGLVLCYFMGYCRLLYAILHAESLR